MKPYAQRGELEQWPGNQWPRSCMIHVNKMIQVDFMEEDGDRVWAGKMRTALDVWLGWLPAVLNLDARYEKPSLLPQSGGRYLFTEKACPRHCRHNSFEVRHWGSPGYFVIAMCSENFVIVMCSEPSTLFLCSGSETYVLYPKKTREDLGRLLYLREIKVSPNFVFVGRSYLIHVEPAWKGHHALCYHIYFKPVSYWKLL